MKFFLLTISLFSFLCISVYAQENSLTVKGIILEAGTNVPLPGANVYWEMDPQKGDISNVDGLFSVPQVTLPATLIITYIGFEKISQTITETDNLGSLRILLRPEERSLEEVVVTERRADENVRGMEMGKSILPISTIKNIPALFGEVDLLRSLQLLPGIQTAGEGTTGLFVRGGSSDQNLIQIDGAPVYNPSHFFGFFSVFNPDALENVELYRGNIPAQYGGRLSSLVDVSLKEGNTQSIRGEGGIGTISSRLTVDGPLFSDKSSFVISGRRTYADIFLGLANDPNIRNNALHFYDLSGKLMFRPTEKDKITISSYYGSDYLGLSELFGFGWSNWVNSGVWKRSISDILFLDVNLYYSQYNYEVSFSDEENGFVWDNKLAETGGKVDLMFLPNDKWKINAGYHGQYYGFAPISLLPDPGSAISTIETNPRNGIQNNFYISSLYDISEGLSIEAGLRLGLYNQVGKGVSYIYESGVPQSNESITDTITYSSFANMKFYNGLEPRVALRYMISPSLSFKAAYNRNFQYIQVATNSSAGLPIDRWVPAGPHISPIRSDQYSIGLFQNLSNNMWEVSIESYYKDFNNIIDLRQGANIIFTDNIETEIRTGRGWAYGLEFLLRKNIGKTTGWLGYTYSRTYRQIEGISMGLPFNPRFDRPHDLSLVLNHQINSVWSTSFTFVYTTGQAVTFPIGVYDIDTQRVPLYGPMRNEDRFPDYHRADASVTYKRPDAGRKWRGSWNFSIYNIYGRKNPFSYQFTEILNEEINFTPTPEQPIVTRRPGVVKTYLFTFLPSITYNFEF
ncbi:TonB-dependent receptor [Anditalea andensis]|uniref:Membrane protein n=1 Tax=Anditalea andensis TaxID=1048983 RepID=A0A074KRK1_9BACT|nr:TonB-dependent receptor [Anditalea andensis]KEO72566.1 membrane protein [Anditalea andensis]